MKRAARLRSIRNPERFNSAAQGAAALRGIARHVEAGSDWVAVSVSISYATREEVEAALAKKGLRLAAEAPG